jgi:glycerol-3-phosphate dehydrogenase
LAHAYGTRVRKILGDAHSLADLGRDFGGGLFQAELEYLRAEEWARASEDVLWRRTKLGLGAPPERAAAIDGFFRAADERALNPPKGPGLAAVS